MTNGDIRHAREWFKAQRPNYSSGPKDQLLYWQRVDPDNIELRPDGVPKLRTSLRAFIDLLVLCDLAPSPLGAPAAPGRHGHPCVGVTTIAVADGVGSAGDPPDRFA
jgi:hypothetical protein